MQIFQKLNCLKLCEFLYRKILRNNCLDFLSTLVVGPHLNDKSTRGRKLQLLQSEIERI